LRHRAVSLRQHGFLVGRSLCADDLLLNSFFASWAVDPLGGQVLGLDTCVLDSITASRFYIDQRLNRREAQLSLLARIADHTASQIFGVT